MTRIKKISVVMRKLLIEKGMDGFSVVELRDASLSCEFAGLDSDEARKKVYRQILRFEKNNWLRSEGSGRKKRYFQTGLFKKLHLVSKFESVRTSETLISDYSVLNHQCLEYKGEMEILLGEIEEYRSLNTRFPELEPQLTPLLEQARERSARLLGKVNVLTNVIRTLHSDGHQTC